MYYFSGTFKHMHYQQHSSTVSKVLSLMHIECHPPQTICLICCWKSLVEWYWCFTCRAQSIGWSTSMVFRDEMGRRLDWRPPTCQLMSETFGCWYIDDEWKELYMKIFLFDDSEEDINDAEHVHLSRAAVEAGMASCSISTTNASPSVSPATGPATVDRKGKSKHKASASPQKARHKKRSCSTILSCFLDIEVEDDDDDDEHPGINREDTEDTGSSSHSPLHCRLICA